MSQPAQQASEVGHPGVPGLGLHNLPGHRQGVLAVDHADHQSHPGIPVVRGVQGQHQGRLRVGRVRVGGPQRPYPAQQFREAGPHCHLPVRTPRQDAVPVVVGPLPQFPAHGLETAVRLQSHRHRVLAAVVGQQRALHPQGQAPQQAVRERGQMPLELAAQGIQ